MATDVRLASARGVRHVAGAEGYGRGEAGAPGASLVGMGDRCARTISGRAPMSGMSATSVCFRVAAYVLMPTAPFPKNGLRTDSSKPPSKCCDARNILDA
jgi:hypothetical protein